MNTFNKTIKITSILAVLTIIPLHRSIAAVACVPKPNSPTSCPWGPSATYCSALGTGGSSSSSNDCNNLSFGDWKLTNCTGSNVSEFSGTSLCSGTSGSYANIGNPVADSGSNCWCKITSIPGFTVASSAWVFRSEFSALSLCTDFCASSCAVSASSEQTYRSMLFSGLGL
ncbi:MAG: hypothetical protein FWG80_04765 [Alphaproteobacteria bacterium]|nr:hypothetical protein [Alphaproteobacteria bacterium]